MSSFQKLAAVFMAAFVLAPFAPQASLAQERADSGCILDRCQDRQDSRGRQDSPARQERRTDETSPSRSGGFLGRDPARSGGGTATGNFDFYVLALSWSSGFCELSGRDKGRNQCADGANLGFVVHGLWPQNQRGFPADCPGVRTPPRAALDSVLDLFPDEGLARYEWRKHGTCSGRSPTDYFADVRRAREAVRIPDRFKDLREPVSMASLDVLRAFTEANPRLRPGMAAVSCPKGVLQEVRICMTKDLRGFVACPEVARRTCRGRVTVPPIL